MKREEYEAVLAMVRTLQNRYPKAFAGRPRDVRPLAIGITEAIFADAPELSPVIIRGALGWWCSRFNYLRTLDAGAARVDLAGANAGVVTAEAAALADAKLMARVKHKNEKAKEAAARRSAIQVPAIEPAKPLEPAKPAPLGLAGLKAAWRARQQQQQGAMA